MGGSYRDKRLQEIRALLKKSANAKHADFHKEYHKSSKNFYGLRSKQTSEIFKAVFPPKIKNLKQDILRLVKELWSSQWFEEQAIGLLLLERHANELEPQDLPFIKKMIGECEGWAHLDWIATKMLGILAINYGEQIYPKVRTWTKSNHLWTRRSAILIHILPARKKKLNAEYALSTFEELLYEKEFFIRKAIGWTLREISKHNPEVTFEFLKEHREKVSGLTMREGARKLPATLKKEIEITE